MYDVNQVILVPNLDTSSRLYRLLRIPSSNSEVDIASVFLSISVINAVQNPEYYEVHKFESSQWILVDSVTTTDGQVNPPMNSDSTSVEQKVHPPYTD